VPSCVRTPGPGLDGWDLPKNYKRLSHPELLYNLRVPNPERTITLKQAFEDGLGVDELFKLTNVSGVCELIYEGGRWPCERALRVLK